MELTIEGKKTIKKYNKKEKKQIILNGVSFIKNQSKKLNKHTQRNEKTDHINHKIHHLLNDPFTFINAYAKISKNKGALTKGFKDDETMRLFGLKKAEIIAKQIQNGEYQFSPVKRTWIPKPGKKKKRPIDVPTQSDRIVQEAIRGILEAIYEPEFRELGEITKNLCNNYGFRPKKSCWSAIEKLQLYSRGCNIIIEGDIVSAYNNVNQDLLLKILHRRIKDKKFLNLINSMLKSGIMDKKHFEHSLNGTPQGGIVSPLLFNIYMLELDRFVYKEIITPVLEENKTKPTRELRSTKYNQASYQAEKSRKEFIKARNDYREDNNNEKKKKLMQETRKTFRKNQLLKLKTPYANIEKLKKGAVFVRYADDWVLALTCNKREAIVIKEKIANYLKNHLKMELDQEKTKITQVTKGYQFLGFEIKRATKSKIMRTLQKNANNVFTRGLRRTTSRQLTIEPHSERILKRLLALKMCDNKYMPKGKPIWSHYDEFEIVQKYALIMRGLFNYYEPCRRLDRINHISYILQYSCAKTIAIRKKISLPQVLQRYGKSLRITRIIKNTKGMDQTRVQQFLDITSLKNIEKKRKKSTNDQKSFEDPFRIIEFWRTKFKMYNECCICGCQDNIQLHHINSISALKDKKDHATVIRSQLNRLQVPVCESCHKDITHGRYNDPTKPAVFYDEFLAKL